MQRLSGRFVGQQVAQGQVLDTVGEIRPEKRQFHGLRQIHPDEREIHQNPPQRQIEFLDESERGVAQFPGNSGSRHAVPV